MLKALIATAVLLASLPAAAADAPTQPELREELLRMRVEDQRVRGAPPSDPAEWTRIDAANLRRLKEIVARHGWPTASMVGGDGASAAWLLAQHADSDPAFQREVLSHIEKLMATGEAGRKDYAYLYDRVHTPQRYGTQGTCIDTTRWVPREIEDPANVDRRRADVGLPPMAEYVKIISPRCAGMAPAVTQVVKLPPVDPAAIEKAATDAQRAAGARGLALAVIDAGQPVLVRAWGERNASGDKLEPSTVMYGASLTKTVFAYTAMQLVDEGRLQLDQPIAAYLPQPLPQYGNLPAYGHWGELAGDERWRRITPRMVLTHATGFANFAFDEPDGKLRIHFAPGSRYAYSGEGIILLQFALERGLGLDLGAEMRRRVFDRFGMKDTAMMWRPAFAANLADGWTIDGKVEPHDERSRVRAAGSMDTTIADMARFAAALVRGDGLSPGAHAEMLKPQLPILTRSQFPTLQDAAPASERVPNLAAGLGLVTFVGPQGPGFFKGGHNESTGNMLVCLTVARRCVVLLANDVRAEAAFPAIVRAALGDTGMPWQWEYGKR
jgi:CubicO group peptidase (beta-lactamase class C family)